MMAMVIKIMTMVIVMKMLVMMIVMAMTMMMLAIMVMGAIVMPHDEVFQAKLVISLGFP